MVNTEGERDRHVAINYDRDIAKQMKKLLDQRAACRERVLFIESHWQMI
jgi:hypothetical protein